MTVRLRPLTTDIAVQANVRCWEYHRRRAMHCILTGSAKNKPAKKNGHPSLMRCGMLGALPIFRPADEQREPAGLQRPCVSASGRTAVAKILAVHCTWAKAAE